MRFEISVNRDLTKLNLFADDPTPQSEFRSSRQKDAVDEYEH